MSAILDTAAMLDPQRARDLADSDARDRYRPMVSQDTMLDMAEEKVLEDADLFADWLAEECTEPVDVRGCAHFGFISTAKLVTEVLMKKRATDAQIAAGWKEVRARYLADKQQRVTTEFERLRAEEEGA